MVKQDKKENTVSKKRRLEGVVASISGKETVVVQTERSYRHSVYGKSMKRTDKYMAHNTDDAAKVGDSVVIQESRPLSKRKRWIIVTK